MVYVFCVIKKGIIIEKHNCPKCGNNIFRVEKILNIEKLICCNCLVFQYIKIIGCLELTKNGKN